MSAFSSTAFSTNAFSISAFDFGGTPPAPTLRGGHFLPIYEKGKRKIALSNIQIIYDKAKTLPRKQTKELREAIKQYVEPVIARQPIIPEIAKIDYEALFVDSDAYKQFLVALDNIQKNIVLLEYQQKEDDELLLITVLACAIN